MGGNGGGRGDGGGGIKTSAEEEDVLALCVQARRADLQPRAHTPPPLNNGWSEAAAGRPGDIIAASLVHLRQVAGRGGAWWWWRWGVVRYSVTERERRSNLQTGQTAGGTAGTMAAAWRKLCGHVLLLLAVCRHGSASE